MFFRALAVHSLGTTNLESSTAKTFKDLLEKLGCDPKQFCGFSMYILRILEDVVDKNNFIYDIDIQDGDSLRELARRNNGKNYY